ncbi:MAG TPA: Lin1244/Lin1753 domain-containing protein [Hanamia sp.]|nr:Lin1244/Lin1753 domain-containing protein [Hanamia sp.]
MDKETFYFKHDYNARNDRKIAALINKHKGAGYGIFWVISEMLHEEGGELELDEITYSAICKDSNEDENLVKKVVFDCVEIFKLFFIEDEKLYSNRVKNNLDKGLSISKKRAKAGKMGAKAKHLPANDEQMTYIKEKKINKENKGICFNQEKNAVTLMDGKMQNLGKNQLFRLSQDDLKPNDVFEGYIS